VPLEPVVELETVMPVVAVPVFADVTPFQHAVAFPD
jgi:hypothetical protein